MWKKILSFFLKKELFGIKVMYLKQKKKKKKESEVNKLEKIKDEYNKFFKYIENESKGINY